MFEELNTNELMLVDGGFSWGWFAVAAAVVAVIAGIAVTIACPPAGGAIAAGASSLSSDFMFFMGAAALV